MTPNLELLAKAISDADFVLSVKRAREEDTGDEYEALAQGAVEALTASGYSIIHDSENHRPTVERAAETAELYAEAFIEGMVNYGSADKDAGRGRQEGHIDASHEIASSLRAMTTGGRDAA